MSREELINTINNLPEDKLKIVIDFIKIMFRNENSTQLSEEQNELLELLKYTVNTNRGDFAEKHDQYLYGISK